MKRDPSSCFIALVISMVILLPTMACESSRGCPDVAEPEIKLVDKPIPYPVLIKIRMLPPLELPEKPEPPGHDADEEEWKAFALEVKRVMEETGTLRAARIEAIEQLIRDHNALETDPPPM